MSERQHGILTTKDREYLLGERTDEFDENGDDYERRVRMRIRDRIFNAIMDFWIIEMYLDEREFEYIFDEDRGKQSYVENMKQRGFPQSRYTHIHENYRTGMPGQEESERNEPDPATTVFEEAFKDVISFIYRGSKELGGIDFEQIVEEGMTRVAKEDDEMVNVCIEIKEIDVDELMNQLDNNEINREEIEILLENPPDSLQEPPNKAVASRQETSDPPQFMQDRRDS